MKPMTAQVRGGRLVLDEPTNLPEGSQVRVAVLEGDDLDDDERARLHESIEAGEAEADAGLVVSEDQLWARLRAVQ